MTKLQRIKNVLVGLLMLLSGALMAVLGSDAVALIMWILAASMSISGIKMLFYYLTMARHMVDGDQILIRGLILFDIGAFTATLSNISQIYIMGYLLGIHAFSGCIDVMRAIEAKKLTSSSWKLNFSTGIVNIILAVTCIVFLRSESIAVYIYSAGLIYSALIRIIMSFRKTAVVYITPS